MPTVLVTRPKKDSEFWAQKLKQLGYTCVVEPLLAIEPVQSPLPVLDHPQAVMITSANALDFLDRGICEKAGLLHLSCFCVGFATAEAARAFGFASVRDAAGDGLKLAKDVQNKPSAKDGMILHHAVFR
jgi:uroporphyrinogen-III synthase